MTTEQEPPAPDRFIPVTLVGGPLDGMETVADPDDPDPGLAMICDEGTGYGPGGRSWYFPDEAGVWRWVFDSA